MNRIGVAGFFSTKGEEKVGTVVQRRHYSFSNRRKNVQFTLHQSLFYILGGACNTYGVCIDANLLQEEVL